MAGLAGTVSFGQYSATYDGNSIGLTEEPKRLQFSPNMEPITSDIYGKDTLLDGVYAGGNVFVLLVLQEWTAAIRVALWPWGTMGDMGIVGRRVTDLAKQLVLTAVTGTVAATVGPTTLTFPLAFPAAGNQIDIILGSQPRNIPLLFQCVPNSSGVWWT